MLTEALSEHQLMNLLESKSNHIRFIDFIQTCVKDKDVYSGPRMLNYQFFAPIDETSPSDEIDYSAWRSMPDEFSLLQDSAHEVFMHK